MKKLTQEQCKSLAERATKRANELRESKLMLVAKVEMQGEQQTPEEELAEALATQQYCCAYAEAWGELCNEATQRIHQLNPVP